MLETVEFYIRKGRLLSVYVPHPESSDGVGSGPVSISTNTGYVLTFGKDITSIGRNTDRII